MSDTPETDATANPLWGDAQELCLLRDLSRKLERERDNARRMAEGLRSVACEKRGTFKLPWEINE